MALGTVAGGVLGSILGGVPTLGLGGGLGSALGSSLGGMIEGGIKERKAKNTQIPLTDPLQISILNNLLAQKRRLETGTAYQAQQDQIRQIGKQAMNNILKLSGGSVGSAMSGINNVNASTNRALNNLYGTMGIEGMKLMGLIQNQADTIAQRRLDIPVQEQRRLYGDSAQTQKDAMGVLSGVLARIGKDGNTEDYINLPYVNSNNQVLNNNVISNNATTALNTSGIGGTTTAQNLFGSNLTPSLFSTTLNGL